MTPVFLGDAAQDTPEWAMLHCSMAHSGALRLLADHLQCAAVSFDMPGHGNGPACKSKKDFFDQAYQLALRVLPDTPVHVFGHSFGGLIALKIALDYPHKVKSLSLFEPVLFAAAKGSPEYSQYVSEIHPFNEMTKQGDLEAATRLFLSFWGQGKMRDDQVKSAMRQVEIVEAQTQVTDEDTKGILSGRKLEGLEIPVLLLRGSQSPKVVAEINQALSTRIGQSSQAMIEQAGHMAPITHPSKVAAEIRDFLSLNGASPK